MPLPGPGRSLASVLAAFAIVTATSAAVPSQEPAVVSIELTDEGLRVTPDRVTVQQGEAIEWTSELPFGVAVQEEEELFGRRLPPQTLRAGAGGRARAAVAVQARVGTYKYSVAVWDGENVIVLDPEIVVQPNRR